MRAQGFFDGRAAVAGDAAHALGAAAALGIASAFGDWVWSRWLTDGALAPALAHGVLFFGLLAVVLAWGLGAPGALRRLCAALPWVGLALAALFYPLAAALGYFGALVATWVTMWIALALLAQWARRRGAANGGERLAAALGRGVAAAVGSGVAFWAVSGMWTDAAFPHGYAVRCVFWTCAFLPGLACLLVGARVRHPRRGHATA